MEPIKSSDFKLPWRIEFSGRDCFEIVDASDAKLASAYFRYDLKKWSLTESKLTPEETKQVATLIDRLLIAN